MAEMFEIQRLRRVNFGLWPQNDSVEIPSNPGALSKNTQHVFELLS